MSQLSKGSLTYSGVSFRFGDGTPYAMTRFVRGAAGMRVQDRDSIRGDGRRFGVDLKSGPTHELALLVQGDGSGSVAREAAVRPLLAALERAWDAPVVRGRSGAAAQLMIGDRFAWGGPDPRKVDTVG